jgi:hypothetical protein
LLRAVTAVIIQLPTSTVASSRLFCEQLEEKLEDGDVTNFVQSFSLLFLPFSWPQE